MELAEVTYLAGGVDLLLLRSHLAGLCLISFFLM